MTNLKTILLEIVVLLQEIEAKKCNDSESSMKQILEKFDKIEKLILKFL